MADVPKQGMENADLMVAPLPENEAERLQALRAYGLMDTPPEAVFDEVAALASYVFQAPIASVCLLDEHRLWFKACIGLDIPELPRESSFSAYAVLSQEGIVVPDAQDDPRFASHPLVAGSPGIRFFAGAPLLTREGHALGTLCVVDTQPRLHFAPEQRQALLTLGRHLMAQVEIRYSSAFLAKALMERRNTELEEQKRMLEHGRELSRLNEMKDRFMTMLAHELRNPLASILNAIELLRSPAPDDALEIIEQQTRHLSRLIEDFLDLSRVTRGKITLKKTTLDVVEAVRAATRAIRPVLDKGGQRFVVELPEEPLWVRADPLRLEQILSNLLGNAAKFTEPGKKIHLSLQREGEEAVLRIRDEGIGIPQEMQEHIFELFVQVPDPRNQGGLGLGLPLVRQLVRLHHGRIGVQSDGQGRGSEFLVAFPLSAPPAGTGRALESASEPAHESMRARRRVLIVEDNPDLAETLRRLIARWGHDTDLASSGSIALEKALAFRPDTALVDIGLPRMNGYEVAECLCHEPELAGLRLIAMSGYSDDADRTHAAQAGFHEFLLKPVDPSMLQQLLEA